MFSLSLGQAEQLWPWPLTPKISAFSEFCSDAFTTRIEKTVPKPSLKSTLVGTKNFPQKAEGYPPIARNVQYLQALPYFNRRYIFE